MVVPAVAGGTVEVVAGTLLVAEGGCTNVKESPAIVLPAGVAFDSVTELPLKLETVIPLFVLVPLINGLLINGLVVSTKISPI